MSATYTVGIVERLLRNYLDIRSYLEGKGQLLPDTYTVKPAPRTNKERMPLGQTALSQPWPFMEAPRARAPMDGKARARTIQDLHVSCLDIEEALKKLHDDDVELLLKYHILQTHTLDQLVVERQVTSRGSMQRRVRRAVERLVRELEARP